jgi:hypothetical protein
MYGRFTSVCWLEDSSILVLLGGLLEALHGQRVLAHVDAGLLEELFGQEIDDAQVEVFAAQERVTVGGKHFELALAVDLGDLDDRHVEGAAAQVVHGDLAILAGLVEAVGQRRRGGLVDDALDLETRDAAGVLGRLALRVVEIRGHGDDGFGHRLTEVILGGLLHLHEHARGNSGGRLLFALGFHPGVAVVGLDDLVRHHVDVFLHDRVVELAADEALDREQGVLRIGHGLALGRLADQHFVILGKRDDGRRGAITLAVLDDARLAAFHDGDAGIRGSQIDADYLSHKNSTTYFWVLTRGPYVEAGSFVSRFIWRRDHDAGGRSSRPFSV